MLGLLRLSPCPCPAGTLEGWASVFATMSCEGDVDDSGGRGGAAGAAGPNSCCSMNASESVVVYIGVL